MEENNGPKIAYFKLTPELAQAIINYMGTKPYQEVYQVVPKIMNLEGVPEVTPVPETSQEANDKEILNSLDEGE